MTTNISTFSLRPTLRTSRNTFTSGLIFGTLIIASFAITSGGAQAACVFNGPNCVTGTYPDLEADAAWLDSAISESDAGANGADADNLPLPARTAPPKTRAEVGKNMQILIAR